ncbi:MAG: hypothetical protein LGR52_01940 [Candidatus Thiosymbion ectosymbiont of Robbea hypermnestra]|nr:hypothetical protein [Candidatus Thiosymbion ectosymbiont of Robbea hypermnestra]
MYRTTKPEPTFIEDDDRPSAELPLFVYDERTRIISRELRKLAEEDEVTREDDRKSKGKA